MCTLEVKWGKSEALGKSGAHRSADAGGTLCELGEGGSFRAVYAYHKSTRP
jgi:hypothetical protein